MGKSITVSISFLTAGKKKELKKCLESLQPLMQSVPSELIIVDTGCNKENRAIIEQYATQIVDFTWCNDFSKARNAGLEKCSGEWFLYLDDDEWFEDMSEIIAFFQTGEYREYQYAMYLVRNYEDFEGKQYNDSPVGRMIRLQPDTHFIYAIHECFANVGTRTKYLNDYVNHYGYVYKNEEEMFAHARRNLIPLLTEHEREPDNLRHILQIMQEYQSLREYDKVEELGCSAIQKYDTEDNEQIYYFNSLLVLTLFAMTEQEKLEKLTVWGERLRNHPYIGKLAEAYVCAILSYGYREIEKYRESMQCTEDYLNFWAEYKKDSSWFTPFETGILLPCFQEKTIQATLENGIMSAIALGQLRKAACWTRIWEKDDTEVLCGEKTTNSTVRILEQLEAARRKKNAKEMIESLKQLLRLHPLWGKVIKIQIEEASRILDTGKVQQDEQAELLKLAEQIKQQVQILVNQGRTQEASQILKQLQSLVPEDEEVQSLIVQSNGNLGRIGEED